MKKITAALLVLGSLLMVGCAPPDNCQTHDTYANDVSFEGHRMSTKSSGERVLQNTLESLGELLETDAAEIEFDVRTTKDNQLVIIHDDNVCKWSPSNVSVSQTNLLDLPKLRLDAKIPTMREVTDILTTETTNIKLVKVDVKAVSKGAMPEFEAMVQELIETHEKVKILYDEGGSLKVSLCEVAVRNGIVVENYGKQVVCK